jgi:excisionase family DNA binding protein
MPPSNDPLQLLTTAEVAALWGVSCGWVTKRRRSGALRCVTDGRLIRFRLADVERFQQETFKPAPVPVRRLRSVA